MKGRRDRQQEKKIYDNVWLITSSFLFSAEFDHTRVMINKYYKFYYYGRKHLQNYSRGEDNT